ncbi:MAG TPA: cupin domain-containing protein [Eubacteriales bacterium]|nr:cupin domain-containing protein [Clostridia bacterium]HRV73948.1 cupin domain-containing protein [Eubacteriales bacterium]
MVRKSENVKSEVFEHKFNAPGSILVRSLVECDAEMNGKGRVFAHTTLQPGCGIGYHIHKGESETYYIYSGSGEFNDNGTIVPVSAGDVTFTPDGTCHGILNTGAIPLELIALILYN